MPRPKRLCIPGIPLHIVQRGNNKQPCFVRTGDYVKYLKVLFDAADRYDAQIHAYTLMTNHVHLLVTPVHEYSASRLMQYVGRSYVLFFNRVHQRTGTLWEGRFRSSIVDNERYLFACYRYIEFNPVRAGIVSSPEEYPWTSYSANALGTENSIVTPRMEWVSLGSSKKERCRNYRRMFGLSDDEEAFAEIRARIR